MTVTLQSLLLPDKEVASADLYSLFHVTGCQTNVRIFLVSSAF